jgi:flagellar biogenesis protein FliO
MQISPQEYLLVLMVGAAVLALWLVVRFPRVAPARMWVAALHVVAAFAVGPVIVDHAPDLFSGLPLPRGLVIAVVLGMLPPAIYIFLSLAWLIQHFQRVLHARY